jgi:hypothetical protein
MEATISFDEEVTMKTLLAICAILGRLAAAARIHRDDPSREKRNRSSDGSRRFSCQEERF